MAVKIKTKGNFWVSASVPILIVFILTILLLPVPTPLLDICIALNLTISLVILFAALFKNRVSEFSSFPAILLVTTLFRLGMNVATTRLILLYGDTGTAAAGTVIQAFANFVVGGSFVVGIVVFIAINIVNLKVITKGATRIAEVAARFTLDAMPGKQMAIDSDLNAGLINEAEAKQKRKELQMESEFYGSMDGAAKFVSGDAIAGLILTGINIVGGLIIGIVFKGMDWKIAAETYTLLTIGDGLVAQIPSIVVSTAAGMIVARAASSGDDLGTEVISQLTSSSRPLWIAAATCAGLAIVPGLPFLPFITLSAATGAIALFRRRAEVKAVTDKKMQELERAQEADNTPKPGSTEEVSGLLGVDTLELEVGYELVSLVETGGLVDRIRSIRRQFALDYGFILPAIHIRDNVRLSPSEYRFMLKGAAIGEGELKPHYLLAMDPGSVTAPIQGIPTKEPAFGLDALWIHESEKERAQFSGYTVVDPSTIVTTHVTELIKNNMHELLGRQEVQHLLDTLGGQFPKVIEELIPNLMTLGQVQHVLCRLLREQISIKDLRTILETLADWAPTIKQPERLAELVRRRLARSITAKYVSDEGVLPLASLNPSVERYLNDNLQQSDEGSFLALDPARAQVLISKLNKMMERFSELGQTPLLLVSANLRAALFNFVDRFVPGYAVISHQEIAAGTKVKSMGVLALEAQ
ncbi:MAG: flagellar biosynthesis protein FlhA [Bdellovibrionota bacterium]|jgi:flagellar biosynthesis protein FlhA